MHSAIQMHVEAIKVRLKTAAILKVPILAVYGEESSFSMYGYDEYIPFQWYGYDEQTHSSIQNFIRQVIFDWTHSLCCQ